MGYNSKVKIENNYELRNQCSLSHHPLLMALFCFGYGAFVLDMGTDPAKNVAGPVVMSLGMICIALFATAATIIRQIIHTYNTVVRYALPVLGYLAALLTFICGWEYISEAATASHFVAGHVICGVAFITACVATTATSSTRFTLIPANSQTTENNVLPQAFNGTQGKLLIVVAALLALATWIWTFLLLAKSDVHNAYYVAGHVMAGIAASVQASWHWWQLSYAKYVTVTRMQNVNGGL